MVQVKGKSLYGFAGALAPFAQANVLQVLGKGVAGDGDVFFLQVADEVTLCGAQFNLGLDDLPVGFQGGKSAIAFLGNAAAKTVGGGFGFGHITVSFLHRRDTGHTLANVQPNIGQLSYAKRKTMVSWIKNGWDSARDWGGLNRGFAP